MVSLSELPIFSRQFTSLHKRSDSRRRSKRPPAGQRNPSLRCEARCEIAMHMLRHVMSCIHIYIYIYINIYIFICFAIYIFTCNSLSICIYTMQSNSRVLFRSITFCFLFLRVYPYTDDFCFYVCNHVSTDRLQVANLPISNCLQFWGWTVWALVLRFETKKTCLFHAYGYFRQNLTRMLP